MEGIRGAAWTIAVVVTLSGLAGGLPAVSGGSTSTSSAAAVTSAESAASSDESIYGTTLTDDSALQHSGWRVSHGPQPTLPAQDLESVTSFGTNGYAFTGAGGSVYLTQDGGATWTGHRMPTNNPMHGIAVTPNGAGWTVGDNGWILKTVDFGLNWRWQPSPVSSGLNAIHAINDLNAAAAGQNGMVLTTNDGGSTWTTSYSNVSDNFRAVYFHNLSVGWVGGNVGKLLSTKDGGRIWSERAIGTGTIHGIDFLDDRNGALVESNGEIWTTSDGGANWNMHLSGFAGIVYDIDVVNSTHAFAVGAGGRFFTSVNSWTSWTFVTIGTQDYRALSFPTPGDGMLVGAAANIQKTANGGANFNPVAIAATPTLNTLQMVDANVTYAFGDAGYGLRTADGGATWSKLTLPNTFNCLAAHFIDANRGWVAQSTNSIINTPDGGTTWTSRTLAFTFNSLHMFDPLNGVAATSTGEFYKTADGGAVWANNVTGRPTNPYGMWWPSSSIGFIGGTGAIQGTVDSGVTWNPVQHNLTGTHNVRAIAPVVGTTNVVAVGTNGVLGFSFTSLNNGASYSDSSPAGIPQSWGVAGPSDKAVFLAADGGQIYRSNDKGLTWNLQNSTVSYDLRGGVSFRNDMLGMAAGQFGTILLTTNGGIEDKIPPTIAATSPAAGATNVPTDSTVSITFSEPMDRAATEGNWRLGPFLTGTYSWAGSVMTWKGDVQFQEDSNYEVRILAGARDLDGNLLGSDYVFNFTTKKTIPPVLPKLNSFFPLDGSINVLLDVKINATYSVAMNLSSVEGAFSLTPGAAGSFNWSADSKTVSWQADALLQEGILFTVKFGPAAKDANGNASGAETKFVFTTLSTAIPPTIFSTDPANDEPDVLKDAKISVKFDKAMKTSDTQLAFTFDPLLVNKIEAWNSPANDEITWTHDPMQPGKRYKVTILKSAKDANNVPLQRDYIFNFTTKADPDLDPPSGECLSPSWVPNTPVPIVRDDFTNVLIHFYWINPETQKKVDDPMNLASVQGVLSVTPDATRGALTWASKDANLSMKLSDLKPGTEYSVKITAAATDKSGNKLSAPVECRFKTDGTPPNSGNIGGVDPLLLGLVGIGAIAAIGGLAGFLFSRAKKRQEEEAARPKGWWERRGEGGAAGDFGRPGQEAPGPVLQSEHQGSPGDQDRYEREGGGEKRQRYGQEHQPMTRETGYQQSGQPMREEGWGEGQPRAQGPPTEEPVPEGWGFPDDPNQGVAGAAPVGVGGSACGTCGKSGEPGDKFCQGCGNTL